MKFSIPVAAISLSMMGIGFAQQLAASSADATMVGPRHQHGHSCRDAS